MRMPGALMPRLEISSTTAHSQNGGGKKKKQKGWNKVEE
jgi:hypothetical protein